MFGDTLKSLRLYWITSKKLKKIIFQNTSYTFRTNALRTNNTVSNYWIISTMYFPYKNVPDIYGFTFSISTIRITRLHTFWKLVLARKNYEYKKYSTIQFKFWSRRFTGIGINCFRLTWDRQYRFVTIVRTTYLILFGHGLFSRGVR